MNFKKITKKYKSLNYPDHILKIFFRLHIAGVKAFYIDTDSLKCESCHKAEKYLMHKEDTSL